QRLEHLLNHGSSSGLVLLLAGCRNAAGRSSRFPTQIIFPPAAGEDGLSVGLSRQRFAGRWPDARAAVRGPRGASAGSDVAAGQLPPYEVGEAVPVDSVASAAPSGPGGIVGCDRSVRPGFAPRWSGLEHSPGPDVADLIAETDDPFRGLLVPTGTD